MTRLIVLAVVAGAACAIAPIPADRLASTEASARGAQEAGADSVPQAKLHLKYANDGIAEGRGLIAAQHNDQAVLVLDRARADAELSLGLTREAQAEWEAEQAGAQARAVRANP